MTDERLITLARNGREEAFRELYERYRDPLLRFGYRLTSSMETAEDLVHDCFISLLRSPARFTAERGSLCTYLYAAIRNLARKHFRDEETAEPPPEVEDGTADSLTILIREETAQLVEQTIRSMPTAWREVLILADYEELSMAQIAAITEDGVNAVKARLHRARQALRRALTTEMENHNGRKG